VEKSWDFKEMIWQRIRFFSISARKFGSIRYSYVYEEFKKRKLKDFTLEERRIK